MSTNILAFAVHLSLLSQPLHDMLVDPLPRALARLGTTQFGHLDPITWVGFAPDGKSVLTADNQARFRFWDVATGRSITQYRSYLSRYSFAMSSDNGTLALSDHQEAAISIFKVGTRKEIQRLSFDELHRPEKERFGIYRFTLSPNGRFLAIWESHPPNVVFGDDAAKRRKYLLDVWDLHNRRRLRSWKTGDLCDVEFCPDGKTLAAFEWPHRNNKKSVRFWDIDSDDEIGHVELPFAVSRIAFRPDGKSFLGVNEDRTALHLFEKSTGKSIGTVLKSQEPLAAFALSPDGKRLALSHGGRLVVHELDGGQFVFGVPHEDSSGIARLPASHDRPLYFFARWTGRIGRRQRAQSRDLGYRQRRVCLARRMAWWTSSAVHAHGHHLLARDMDMNLSYWDLRAGAAAALVGEPRLPYKERTFNLIAISSTGPATSRRSLPTAKRLPHSGWMRRFAFMSWPAANDAALEGSDEATCLAFRRTASLSLDRLLTAELAFDAASGSVQI